MISYNRAIVVCQIIKVIQTFSCAVAVWSAGNPGEFFEQNLARCCKRKRYQRKAQHDSKLFHVASLADILYRESVTKS